jgi:hypothetical protein
VRTCVFLACSLLVSDAKQALHTPAISLRMWSGTALLLATGSL